MVMGLHSRKHSRNVSTNTAATVPVAVNVEHFQIIGYLRRKPGISRSAFYEHWTNVHAKKVGPWAEKHGALSYKQIQTSGLIIPNSISQPSSSRNSTDSDPLTAADLIQPVKFDGIAIWEVTSLEKFYEAMKDPYYRDTIEPDEHNILDKEGLGGGIVAMFSGKVVTVVENGKNLVGTAESDEFKGWRTLMERKDLVDFQDAPDM